MKRSQFVILAIAFVTFASAAHAQVSVHEDQNKVTIDVKYLNPTRTDAIVEAIGKQLGYLVVFVDDRPTTEVRVDLSHGDPGELLVQLLRDAGNYLYRDVSGADDQRILLVSKAKAQTTALRDPLAQSSASASAAAPPVRRSPYPLMTGPISALPTMYDVPDEYSPELGMSEMEWVLARNRLPSAHPVMARGFGINSRYSQTVLGDDMFGFYDPSGRFFQDEMNRRNYGLLKIDGPDSFLQSVRVIVDGRDKTNASKANNKWNRPVFLKAGSHIIEFVKEGPGGPIAFRRDVDIDPADVAISLTGNASPQYLHVTGNEFKFAQHIYRYQQLETVEKVVTTRKP